jgi:hypothetical protein
MRSRRLIARWTALIVLMNIGIGFCDCLRDAVIAPINSSSLSSPTKRGIPAGDSSCGDNCESCDCHASIVIVEPTRFATDLAVARLSTSTVLSASTSDYVPLKQPPRA